MTSEDKLRIIKDIRRRQPEGIDADHWIVSQLGIIEDIQRDMRVQDREEEREHERHKQAIAAIRERRNQVRSRCPHVFVHFGDPAGGFASFDECAICGQ